MMPHEIVSLRQVVTAVVLLFDVLFKVGATVVSEGIEHMLHRRVTRALADREANNNASGRSTASRDLTSAPRGVDTELTAPQRVQAQVEASEE